MDELDLRAYVPAAGGLIMLELLRLPPQPKCVSGWTIRQGELVYCLYSIYCRYVHITVELIPLVQICMKIRHKVLAPIQLGIECTIVSSH